MGRGFKKSAPPQTCPSVHIATVLAFTNPEDILSFPDPEAPPVHSDSVFEKDETRTKDDHDLEKGEVQEVIESDISDSNVESITDSHHSPRPPAA